MNIMDKLAQAAVQKSPVCVGLDTQYDYLPAYLKEQDLSLTEKIVAYNKKIVDATYEVAGCFKLQIACYEAMGMAGMEAFKQSLAYVRKKGCIAISDVKRGDISSTAKQYAQAHFTGDFETDIITINAYMGEDAVSPYYPYLEKDKGLFVLIRTSNPSAGQFEDLSVGEEKLHQSIARQVSDWGENFREDGFSAIGAVTGCTYPEEFAEIHARMPHTFFLIPGYGAQGGTGKDIAAFFKDGICGVVNSSRGIITAHKKKSEGEDFDLYIHDAAVAMKEDIAAWL